MYNMYDMQYARILVYANRYQRFLDEHITKQLNKCIAVTQISNIIENIVKYNTICNIVKYMV